MHYENWGVLVSARFPPRNPSTVREEWDALKVQLSVGQTVKGEVVAKAPFGAWLDLEVGFPGLVLIPDVAGLTPERYREDAWCPIGSTVTAVVLQFNDRTFQVRVGQIGSKFHPGSI